MQISIFHFLSCPPSNQQKPPEGFASFSYGERWRSRSAFIRARWWDNKFCVVIKFKSCIFAAAPIKPTSERAIDGVASACVMSRRVYFGSRDPIRSSSLCTWPVGSREGPQGLTPVRRAGTTRVLRSSAGQAILPFCQCCR